jgi:protein-L-isoaspartate(D-aspartate) O-methyltransferase
MSKLTNDLIRFGYLETDAIIEAFERINRIEFVRKEMELQANVDVALPIGCGQTISQPLVVVFMLELLDPQEGQKIMDVGSGSGWTTALLSDIVGQKGKIISLEIIEELLKVGEKNVDKFGFVKNGIAEFYNVDGNDGFPTQAPYDRILVSASAACKIPPALKEQLAVGGKMVLPVQNSIVYIEKISKDNFFEEKFPGFTFVPLISSR